MELRYRFTPDKGPAKEFLVRLDPETFAYNGEPAGEPPDWTRLEYQQCPNCPLKPKDSPRCPVAVNLAPLAESFKDSISYEMADVVVEAEGRSYSRRVPMQAGVSALFGLVMSASGCPILDKMRPMAFTHLPFPSLQETEYRAMSMYLLAQFIAARKGLTPDWTLHGLAGIYDAIREVNVHLAARLRSLDAEDANANAVVKLDCFADFTSAAIRKTEGKNGLGWLEKLFRPYWA